MGECLITRRGGESYELPVLDEAYPKDISMTVIEGNTVSASFSVNFVTHGKPAEYSYQWYANGAAIPGANGSVCTIDEISGDLVQNIYCEVTNKAGTVTTRIAKLNVVKYYKPTLNAGYPADVPDIGIGYSNTFKVEIATAGYPAEHTYQWYYDGAAVSGATSPTYTRNAEQGTHTVYCIVTNAAGSIVSRTATVTATKLYLYNYGDNASVSGGWKTVSGSSGAYSTGTPSNQSGADYLRASTNDSIGFLRHNNLIDLTPYTKVHFNCTASDNSGYTGTGNCCPAVMPDGTTNVQNALVKQSIPSFGTHNDLQVDIANINQTAWIGWWFYDWGSMSANGTVTIRQIWLT